MRSKRINLYNEFKLQKVNQDTMDILKKYKVDMSMRNLSSATIEAYESDLKAWFIYVLDNQGNRSVRNLTDDDITEFLYLCKCEGNNSERLRRRLSSIGAFYKFMRKKKLVVENPTEFIDRPKHGMHITMQTFLTPEQVALMRERLISADNLQLRTYAMLSLSTMGRVGAIASIRWDQIDLDEKVIKGVREKEGKIVDLFFSDEVKYLLVQLKLQREGRNQNDYGWVFFSGRNKQKPICSSTLCSWCKRIGNMIGVPTLHPHDFRHSGATLLKNAGMALEDVSVLLSHESTDVTKKYYIKEDTGRISNIKRLYNI